MLDQSLVLIVSGHILLVTRRAGASDDTPTDVGQQVNMWAKSDRTLSERSSLIYHS